MKRIICICLVMSILLLACDMDDSNLQVPVAYFYQTVETDYSSENGMITVEMREAKGHATDYQYLIEQYLNGPRNYQCISPFPAGTILEELNIDSNKAQLVLSPHMSTLSGAELTLACACLTKTVIEMTGVRTVEISTSYGTLNGSDTITMTADSFVLWNGN